MELMQEIIPPYVKSFSSNEEDPIFMTREEARLAAVHVFRLLRDNQYKFAIDYRVPDEVELSCPHPLLGKILGVYTVSWQDKKTLGHREFTWFIAYSPDDVDDHKLWCFDILS